MTHRLSVRILVFVLFGALHVGLAGSALAGTPPHDDCSSALAISALPFDHTEPDIENATWDPTDPSPCVWNEHTVWYSITPAQDGWILLTTAGSDFDSFVWVGTGSCGNMTEVACDDDSAGNFNAEVVFEGLAGTTYYVQIGALTGIADGTLQVHAEATGAPPDPGDPVPTTGNDACASPAAISQVPMNLFTGLDGTGEEPDDAVPSCYPIATYNTVWYSLETAVERQVRIDTTDSTFHSVIGVFTGTCGDLVQIDCDHNYGINGTYNHGMVDFLAEPGVTYRIMVSSPFPVPAGREYRLEVTDGISHPIDVSVRDAQTIENLEAQAWIRDTTGGNYTLRQGLTGADGFVRLYPPNPHNYEVHVSAVGHVVAAEPASVAGGPAQVDFFLDPMAAPQQPAAERSRIAFVSDGLRTVLPDGSDERMVVDADCLYDPAWSPDGSRIAFGSSSQLACTGATWSMWIVNADGTDPHILTLDIEARPHNIAWSPDGRWITYDYFRPSEGFSSIWRLDAETGAGPTRLISFGTSASWSPDASMIVYQGSSGTKIARADGSHDITIHPWGGYPDWSPDGRSIAVGGDDIRVFDIDGTNARVVVTDAWESYYYPEWSPDSQRLFFLGGYLENFFYVAGVDGSGLRRVHAGGPINRVHDWSFRPTYDVVGDFAPRVHLLAPNGGERMIPGQVFTIRWEASDDLGIASQDLYLERNGTTTAIATGIAGDVRAYDWTVPDLPSHIGSKVLIRVADAVGQDAIDRTNYWFSIADETDDPWVMTRVTYPTGGESFTDGEVVTITWEHDSYWTVTDSTVEYSLDGGVSFTYVDYSVAAGVFSVDWTVPNDVTHDAVIRVRQNGVYSAPAESGYFSLNVGAVEALQLSDAPETVLSWQAAGGQTDLVVYDVIRGDLDGLVEHAGAPGSVDLGGVTCIANDTPDTSTTDDAVPAAGHGFFYVVRPDANGTYGSSSSGSRRIPGSGDCS